MVSLADIKKNSQATLNKLKEEVAEKKNTDDRFWTPTVNQAGNGNALIRFLPAAAVDGEEGLPWAKYWDHGFKGPNGWYIEKSLTSIGKADPLSEYNSKLWATEDPVLREQVRKQKRRLHYVSNILVINDPDKPENNGKVFLFKYGEKIHDKIKNIMTPDAALGEEPNNPFDFWTGQNFKLKIKKVGEFRNYDDSTFASPSPIAKTDKEIEAIWNSQHSLKEFTNPEAYKSYEELSERLNLVLGNSAENARPAKSTKKVNRDEDSEDDDDVEIGIDGDASSLDDILDSL